MIEKFSANIFKRLLAMIFLLSMMLSACGTQQTMDPVISASPASQPTEVPIAAIEVPTYDNNGITVYLKAEFPPTPAKMKVYAARDEQLATVDSVKVLAKQFNMNGAIYELDMQSGIPGGMLGSEKEYLVVDGNRQLRVRSDKYFTYIPDNVLRTDNLNVLAPPDAETLVKEFMQTYGFDFAYRVEQADPFTYAALALSPEGFDLWYSNWQFDGLRFSFDKNGIAFVSGNLLYYDQADNMEIISAEEALKKLLDSNDTFGYLQSGGGSGFFMVGDTILKQEDFKKWTHVRPLDEMITYNGYLSSSGKSVEGGAPFILLNGYTVVGNTSDIPENMQNTFVEARGQFHDGNGVKTFEMESWKKYDGYEESIFGTLQREGDQFILDDGNGKKYVLQDVPTDIPLPMSYTFARGVIRDGVFDWNVIDNNGGGGGGGGGGGISGFYKINFSGTPISFPTPILPTPTPEPSLNSVEGLRGTLQVTLFQYPDGTQQASYMLVPYDDQYGGNYFRLQGNVDDTLKSLNNYPIDVWGTMDSTNGQIMVERYENPFPDVKFQIISGSQSLENVDGQPVTIVTAEDGTRYLVLATVGAPAPTQLTGTAFMPDPSSLSSAPNPNTENMLYEALIVPGETLLGYPGMRVFNSALGIVDGKPSSLKITSDQLDVLPTSAPLISMIIEKIELAYFAADMPYSFGQVSANPIYVQPVWRFYGHYDDGSPFEILIQALKQDFLLPEVNPATGS